MNTNAHSAEPLHGYRLRAPSLIIYLLGLLLLLLVVVGTVRYLLSAINVGSILLVSVLACTYLYAIPFYVQLFLHRLVISAWGVTLYGGGFRIDAPWSHIVGVQRMRNGSHELSTLAFQPPPIRVQNPNQVRQEQVPVITINRWGRLYSWEASYRKSQREIALTKFVIDVRASALGKDIQRFAPHLFAGESSQASDGSS